MTRAKKTPGKSDTAEAPLEATVEALAAEAVLHGEVPAADGGSERPEAVTAISPDPVPEPAPALEAAHRADLPPAAPAPAAGSRGGIVLPVLGGAIAAVLGFGLSHFDVLNLRNDAGPEALAALDARVGAVDASLKAAEAATAALSSRFDSEISAAQTAATAPQAAIDALAARLAVLESSVSAGGGSGEADAAALAALRAEVQALKTAAPAAAVAPDAEAIRQVVDAELSARAEALNAEASAKAEAIREAAVKDAARLRLGDALAQGRPWADALAALDLADPPEGLTHHAETGLPTASALAESFAEPARAALDAARREVAAGSESMGDRLWTFLELQTGARALSPREGDDPDAVLSRAEAATRAGDLPAAIAELEALPATARAELAAWTAQVQDRIAAEAALAALPSAQN